jgi:hypothetical protein
MKYTPTGISLTGKYAEQREDEIICKVLCVRIHARLRGHWLTNVYLETIARGAASVNILGRNHSVCKYWDHVHVNEVGG